MAAITPACTGEPVTAKISHGKASSETCDPTADIICPPHSNKKSRLCHNETGRIATVGVFGASSFFASGDESCNCDIAFYYENRAGRLHHPPDAAALPVHVSHAREGKLPRHVEIHGRS